MLFLLNSCVFYKNSKVNTCNVIPFEYTSVTGRKLTGTVIDGIEVPIEIKRRWNKTYYFIGSNKKHFLTTNPCNYELSKKEGKWYIDENKELNYIKNNIDTTYMLKDGMNFYFFNDRRKIIGIRQNKGEIFTDYGCDTLGNVISHGSYRFIP